MENKKIVILGANGTVGKFLIKDLISRNYNNIYALSRSTEFKKLDNITYDKVDVLDHNSLESQIKYADIVYVLVGFEYKTNIWRRDWPKAITNITEICSKYKSKLVFFDNVYAYGKVEGKMTEETPKNPISEKGKVRLEVENIIKNSHQKNNLTYVIAKSADFYGPEVKNSAMYISFIENMMKNKTAFWFGNLDKKHTFTYVPDAARALSTLGLSDKANNQIWHLPSKNPGLTGREYSEIVAKILDKKVKVQAMGKFMVRFMSLFIPILKEFPEMLYQFDSEYYFDSSKYEKTFGDVIPIEYEKGIEETIKSYL